MKELLLALLLGLLTSLSGCSGSVLSEAAIRGDLQGVKEHVKSGGNVNEIDQWGWTPLLWSVYYGHFTTTQLLLEMGANPNKISEKRYDGHLPGTTPLILASIYGRDDAVELLLNNKADPSAVDWKWKKALDYAEEHGCKKCAAVLKGK